MNSTIKNTLELSVSELSDSIKGLIEDNFEIYGYNFTNNIYFKEYFNKLSDSQTDDYIIKIKNYNYKKFQPHIKLLNEVDGLNKITGHEIYSYNGILEIKYSDNGTNNWVPLKIDANGNTFIKGGLEMKGDIKFDGKIYDANGNDLIEILNKDYYKEYQVNSSNIHFNSDGSNGVEIHAYSSSNYDDFKFFNVQDFLDGGIITDVMVLHKRLNEVPQYKIDLYGDIDTSNGILRVEGRDIIRDTCNYILDSSNVLSNKISNLETDSISEEAHSKNRFIVNHEYNNDLLINGELRINSNLIVLGEQTRLDTQVYSSEQIEIVNNNTDVALKITQTGTSDIVNIFNNTSKIFTILQSGNVGINTNNPNVSLEINRTDSIKIPVGTNVQRPTYGAKGYIRYNTDLDRFEGFGGTGNTWGALGGIKDLDGDTYISSENASGEDNDELKFITSNFERMIITSNGLVGIGNTEPEYKLDLFGDFRSDGNIFVNRKIGINTYSPDFTIHMDTNDGILIPSGNTINRPNDEILKKGVIRYNTDNDEFEGYGPGGSWGSLGGVKDVNGDTYISAENNPGDNNDELKFFTSNFERMVLTSNGNLGIGNTKPNYKIDVNGEVNASAFNINGVPFRLEFPKGMMLQTKHITYTGTRTKSDIQTDWVPIDDNITTGFVINVKPSHVTSKILLNLICHIGMDYLQTSKWWGLKLYRKIGTGNWTEVLGANGTGDNNGSACWISHNLGAESSIYSHSITNVTGSYEDEPSTTDDVYYTIYWKSRLDGTGARLYLNKSAESHSDNYPKPSSSLSASEIWNNGVPYIPPISSSVISLSGEKVGIGCVPTHDSPYKLNVYGDIKCHNLFQTSDKRYKNNIEQLDSILHLINDIVPVSYNTENDSKTKYGFIAQDLEDIIPDIVNIPRDRKDLYSIDYISMIPLLTKSIQELSNIINNQQKEINKLKSKL